MSLYKSKLVYSQPLEPVIQQTWWHIDDVYFPHPYHDIRLIMDIQVPVYYSHPYKSLRLRWVGGDYFGGMRVYGRNNGHKEIAFFEEVRVDKMNNSIPDGISLYPVYSDFPIVGVNGHSWYHLKLEIQYQIYDKVYDGTYEGDRFKPMWKKYPYNFPSEEIQLIESLENIQEYAKLIPKLQFSLKYPTSFLQCEKIKIEKYATSIQCAVNQLLLNLPSKSNSSLRLFSYRENIKVIQENILSIRLTLNYIKSTYSPIRDTYVYRKKVSSILSSIDADLDKIVKLSYIFNGRNQGPIFWRRVQRKVKSVISSMSLSCHEYIRNSIRVELLLRGIFQPEFYISLPPSWRIGTIRLLDDYLIGIKHEGRDIKLIATVVDSLDSTVKYVNIPLNPPFISRISGGRREYKIVPTDLGLNLYQSLLNYPYKFNGVRIEYITQVSNTMSLFSLIPWMFIVIPIAFLIGSFINPSFQPTNIALCVSFVVMYLSYTYSYMTIKAKGHDIPHRRIYWAALISVTIYVVISLVVNISSWGTTDASTLSINISNLMSFVTQYHSL